MPIALMLATLTDRRDFGDGWLLERKFDGERCVARKHVGDVRLESRTGKELTGTYPEVAAAVAAQGADDLLLDGEVVAYDSDRTSFSRLQQRLGVTDPNAEQVATYPVVYCVFDLLEVDGDDLTDRPLLERRARMERAIRPSPALQVTEAWHGDSQRRFAEACRAGWEGLIAKRADAAYAPGRSRDWLKLKCAWGQEFVIGGYTDPAGSRTDFGALLVGYYEQGRLRYAGKVGTGYTSATLRNLGDRLRGLENPESPFVDV
ncbi:MAG TPA: non-homologous end-joining DNA ligase, partial [Actinomycetota bacterium]